MRGFHREIQCMKKTINQLSSLLEKNNISLPQRINNFYARQPKKYHEMCHSLKEILSQSKAYLIDSVASNHMVSSKESFTTITLSEGISIHIGDDPKIPTTRRGSI